MITQNDIQKYDMPPEVLARCLANPVPGATKLVTGQLKAIGDWVLQQVIGFDEEAFNMQLDSAREMGVSCVCEDVEKKAVGISTTVSLIRDSDVFSKNIIVPSGQIRKHQYLDQHHVLAVFVVGNKVTTDGKEQLGNVTGVYAAGWLPIFKLRTHVKQGGSGAFQVHNMALATAPAAILNPLPGLMNMVRWHHACV